MLLRLVRTPNRKVAPMNRTEFRELLVSQPVQGSPSFAEYFDTCLLQMTATYLSLNRRIPEDRRAFHAVGASNALNSYVWPAKVTYLGPPCRSISILDYAESSDSLSYYRDGLRRAIEENPREIRTWTSFILQWGMGSRGASAQQFIESLTDPAEYLLQIDAASDLNGDTTNINSQVVLQYNSGLSKIHSLASTSGLVIYDSRVAFAIGECVNGWAESIGMCQLPSHLRFMQAGRRTSDPENNFMQKPRGQNFGLRHPVESRNFKWLETQVRASWLFELALERNPDLWASEEMVLRLHNLEAAFFMLGAYAQSIVLPEAA